MGYLQVFEESARDGSAVNVVQVEVMVEPGKSRMFSCDADSEGWITEFADLPADFDAATFQLAAEHRAPLEGLEGGGLFLQGNNASDDLFMFYKRCLARRTTPLRAMTAAAAISPAIVGGRPPWELPARPPLPVPGSASGVPAPTAVTTKPKRWPRV